MLEFFKMFFQGILYTLLFPFIVFIFALYLVYALGNYLVLEFISLFGFFFGYVFTTETELEKKLNNKKEVNVTSERSEAEIFDDFFLQEDVVDDLKGSDNNE